MWSVNSCAGALLRLLGSASALQTPAHRQEATSCSPYITTILVPVGDWSSSTVAPTVSDPETVTVTRSYIGTANITGPTTVTTTLATGTLPATAVIETTAPSTITITRPYTGNPPITSPTTVTTISASDTSPATVVIETPAPSTIRHCPSGCSDHSYYSTRHWQKPATVIIETPAPITVTITRPYTGTSTLASPTTVTTISATGTNPATVVVER
ncbi:hypothetical protein PWT90_02451 [Aphanocladium album]|nr:hypothetical protein PWT90_02451 [Aphanocladium album]